MTTSINKPEHVPDALFFDFDIYADSRISDDLHRDYWNLHQQAPALYYAQRRPLGNHQRRVDLANGTESRGIFGPGNAISPH